jgi:hypothetical protein
VEHVFTDDVAVATMVRVELYSASALIPAVWLSGLVRLRRCQVHQGTD